MGYYVTQRGADFKIKKENLDVALQHLKLHFLEPPNSDDILLHQDPLDQATTLPDALEYWHYEAQEDNDGNIVDIVFQGEKYYSEVEDLWKVLAPFVEQNSFIEMQGEEGEIWRWSFSSGKMVELHGRIVWE